MMHAILIPLAASMEALLNELEGNVLGAKLGAVTEVATALAAACVAVSMIGVARQYLSQKEFDWWKFFRPIVIFLVVMNFSTVVLRPVRGIMGVFNTRLTEAMGSSTESFKTLFRERAETMCHEEFGRDDDEVTFQLRGDEGWLARNLKGIANKLTKSFFNINEKMNLTLAVLLAGVMFFFLNMTVSVMMIIAQVNLIIMAILGPYTFALSILTTYPGGIKLWIERYIQYTLWQPLLYFFMYLGTQIMILGNQVPSWGGFWTWCFLCLAIFTVIRQVPGWASMVIESSGTEALANQLSGIGGQVLQKASSAAMLIR